MFVSWWKLTAVVGSLVKSGDWAVRHKTVPDLAIGEQHSERGDSEAYQEELGEQRWGQPLNGIGEEEEIEPRGRVRFDERR